MRHHLVIAFAMLSAWSCSPSVPPFDEGAAIEHGRGIAGTTFQQLSARLQAAMASEGPSGALQYCSVAALPLVDSLSVAQGIRIKRTSDRIRAPHDAPDADEERRLNEVLALLSAGTAPADIPPQAVALGDSVAYYQPILIAMPTCLKCHGTAVTDVDSLTLAAIRERYPQDAAMGYRVGDFRGLWTIRWKR
ncbi:MAG: DUF3365 domain-containing protein [Flavobacteriales bacterium]|nr:MAG: DUF3365 domain-containing protein [Flavobacteriales bacterium]